MITSNKITIAGALAYLGRKPEWKLVIPDERKKITEALESAINSGGWAMVKLRNEWDSEIEVWYEPIAERFVQETGFMSMNPDDTATPEGKAALEKLYLARAHETGVNNLVIDIKFKVGGWLLWAASEEAKAMYSKVEKVKSRLRKGESILGAMRKLGYTPDDLAWYFGENCYA